MIRLRTTVGSWRSAVDGRPRQIRLAHEPLGEQRLIPATQLAAGGEQQHAGGQPVQSMGGRKFRQVEFTAQSHQRGLRDVAAARHGGQKMRLVDHDDVLVAVQNGNVERHRNLVTQLAVQVHALARRQHRRFGDGNAVGANHFSGKHFRACRIPEPGDQLGHHRSTVAQPHPRRSEPVAGAGGTPACGGRRGTSQLSGTGSRISALASGAAARNASADSSSGWACDITSASTRAM